MPTAVNNIQYKTIQEIDFTSAKTKKRKLDEAINSSTMTLKLKQRKQPAVSEPASEELSALYSEFNTCGVKPVILSLIPGYAKFPAKSP